VLTAQLVVAALVTGALYSLVGVSLNLIYGTMRLLNIAHGDIVMLGAYATYWWFTLLAITPLVAFFIVPIVAAALGIVTYRALFGRMVRRTSNVGAVEANSLLVFFGLSIIVENLAALLFSGTPRGFDFLDTVLRFHDMALTENRLVGLITALIAITAVVLFFRLTTWGLAVRALIQSRDASALVGVDVDAVFMISSALGFALAGLAGVIISTYEEITPFMGGHFTVVAFVIIILGGLGNLMGSVAGGMILGVLETLGVALTGPNYQSILVYGVFIAILLLRPQGLFGSRVAS
jgi:branched-chain amino acid transport system permease protein